MAALLTGDKEDTDKVTKYITKCKAMGIKVLPPDVNVSEMDFTVQGDSIVFGLGAVKNVGAAALESIIQTRDKKGKFSSVYDFTERVDLTKVNKRIIETLIKCGAFDSMPYTRSQKFAIIDKAVGQALSKQKDQQRGQMSLFEVMPAQGENSLLQEKPPEIPEWPRDKMLEYEKELLGFYVTSHPLDPYIDQLQGYGVLATSAVVELGDSPSVKIGGIVQSVKEKFTKKRERMANVMFEDLEGTIELVVFPRSFLECENKLRSGQPLIVDCLVKSEEGRQSIILNHVVTLQEADKATGANVHITMNEDQVTPGKIEQFKALVQQFQGDYPMFFHVVMKGKCQTTLRPRAEYGVNPCSQFLQEARQLFGDEAVSIRK
jgi:DNA polymerase-3 subunit alpha